MRKFVSTATALAVASAGILLVAPSGAVAGTADRQADRTPTAFALSGSGFGTRARGGEVPAGSDTTAYQALGCTNMAGGAQRNHITTATIPGAGTVFGSTTKIWTTSEKGVVSSYARNSTAKIVLAGEGLGELEINALETVARAFHDAKGFHAETNTVIGSLTYTPAAGEVQELPVPTPGQPVTIPGLATIEIGTSRTTSSADGAQARAESVQIDIVPTLTRVRVGHTDAAIWRGVQQGVFNGRSFGVSARAADDNVQVGKQPLSLMPCQGTDGKLLTKSIASVDLSDNVMLRGVSSRQEADQTKQRAWGHERGRVDLVEINDAELLVETVVGRANVTRTDRGVQRNADGTRVGTVTFQGEEQEFPDSGVLEIPGVARLERDIVKRTKNGIQVTALRITLLDGTGAVLTLGQARMIIRDSRL